ncbi:MAG: CBS domain-containing protein [Clostridiales bacterium]|nr:CBS domain-containing protein [Clostridiales bacterium]
MNVSDIMTGHVISICEDEPVVAAARIMKQSNIGALPVRDGKGKLKGIVTDRDIVLRCVASNANVQDVKIGEIMSRNLVTASPFEEAEKAVARMGECQVRRLPVTDNGVLVGIVALGDIARKSEFEMEAGEALSEISANFRRK